MASTSDSNGGGAAGDITDRAMSFLTEPLGIRLAAGLVITLGLIYVVLR
jgi:hypothetical protein